jgi:hypothetical protein
MQEMLEGHTSPWGLVQYRRPLGEHVTLIATASHGGLHLDPVAAAALPDAVRKTFLNGAEWAEEDCEAVIALSILGKAGIVDLSKTRMTEERIHADAARTVAAFQRYAPASQYLGG